jgi:hypothetical protein
MLDCGAVLTRRGIGQPWGEVITFNRTTYIYDINVTLARRRLKPSRLLVLNTLENTLA